MKPMGYEPIAGLLTNPAISSITGFTPDTIDFEPPDLEGGLPLMMTFSKRRSQREFTNALITERQLGDLLWAADGINRPESGGRTAPSPHGYYEIDVYAVLPFGVYRYDTHAYQLILKRAVDACNLTGYIRIFSEVHRLIWSM